MTHQAFIAPSDMPKNDIEHSDTDQDQDFIRSILHSIHAMNF